MKKFKFTHSSIATPAQEWARQRNWNKRMLKGVLANIGTVVSSNIMTKSEGMALLEASKRVNAVIRTYAGANSESKARYLKHRVLYGHVRR